MTPPEDFKDGQVDPDDRRQVPIIFQKADSRAADIESFCFVSMQSAQGVSADLLLVTLQSSVSSAPVCSPAEQHINELSEESMNASEVVEMQTCEIEPDLSRRNSKRHLSSCEEGSAALATDSQPQKQILELLPQETDESYTEEAMNYSELLPVTELLTAPPEKLRKYEADSADLHEENLKPSEDMLCETHSVTSDPVNHATNQENQRAKFLASACDTVPSLTKQEQLSEDMHASTTELSVLVEESTRQRTSLHVLSSDDNVTRDDILPANFILHDTELHASENKPQSETRRPAASLSDDSAAEDFMPSETINIEKEEMSAESLSKITTSADSADGSSADVLSEDGDGEEVMTSNCMSTLTVLVSDDAMHRSSMNTLCSEPNHDVLPENLVSVPRRINSGSSDVISPVKVVSVTF